MKAAFPFGLLWAAILPVVAQGSLSRLERLSISGTDHVRLEDWARANHFQIKWTVPKKELRLSGGSTALVFTVDAARISLDSVAVWLSAPIALRNDAAWIPVVDITTTITPLLFPSKNPANKPIRHIVLDPGHGGKDPGKEKGRQQEKTFTLLLAKEVAQLLNKAGIKATLTRTDDSFVELPVRPGIARQRGADLFVSLHFNAFGESTVKGLEVYCMTPAHTSSTKDPRGMGERIGAYPGNRCDARNILLGYQLQKALLRNLSMEDRGVRRERYAVLRSAEMPAVLIEGGFMSNPAEAKRIYDPAGRRQMAQAIVEGLKAYQSLVE
jgi:N-acetylmuramoyl-L-alanine amidase